MEIVSIIQKGVIEGVKSLYGSDITEKNITMNVTRKEFEGDYTVVVFPFTKMAKKGPEAIANELGTYLVENVEEIAAFNVIKGFLNLSASNSFWNAFLEEASNNSSYGMHAPTGKKVMVEFSSPNTNKPLHLGHIRNILLGWSCSKILEAAGNEVIKVQIVNNRGIAICKSMLSWQKFGEGKTPESTGIKGDHFVGDYYVNYSKKFELEYGEWQNSDAAKEIFEANKKGDQDAAKFFKEYKNTYFNEYSTLGKETKEMVVKWEANDPDTMELWKTMNNWVLGGFDTTYNKLGVSFDKLYFESDTYLLGKEIIEKGLAEGVFTQEGKRIWVDLEKIGLGKKTVIKSDGTSTYTAQDLGTAQLRWKDFGTEQMVYVVGDEQISHFQGVFEILKRLKEPYADGLYHLAYGMVDLPTGTMKTREGTVVDADDLIAEVIEESRKNAAERGEISELDKEAQLEVIRRVGMAALKYFIIKVHPKKRMTFNPKESVDLQGQTGPYIQYSFVRINGLLKRAKLEGVNKQLALQYTDLQTLEKDLLKYLYQYPSLIKQAADDYDPSAIANFCYALAKTYSKFWHDHPVFTADSDSAKAFRIKLSSLVGQVLKSAMHLLGIEMPEKM